LRALASRPWVAWRRTAVLALGICLAALLPLQFTRLPPVAVGVFALATLALGVALLAASHGAAP